MKRAVASSRFVPVDAFEIADAVWRRCAGSVTALHHLALGSMNVERLAGFYRDVLELPEVTRHFHEDGTLRSVWLDLGSSVLMIERCEQAPLVTRGIGSGLFLLALRVPRERRASFETRLDDAGCAIEARTEWTSYARDPDGNRIAISARPLTELHVPR